ncbi:MAG: TonB-dependent receptor plug [Bacteroidetes bacterium]|nr:TonB-dependent receptor plug [Bacteroidota bacterium]
MLCSLSAMAAALPADRFSLSGIIKDAANGEVMTGVNVYIRELKSGAVTNNYGFYSVTVPRGKYTVEISYLGYQTLVKKVNLMMSQKVDVELRERAKEIAEIEVKSQRKDMNQALNSMGAEQVSINAIRKIPALMGEVDLLKVVQLLPGVVSAGEGTSNFSVRGGGIDQNLIVLDDATIYNASHMMGFFSVFNNDAIRNMTLYKGDIPASYGGRLSSLLDVHTKDGNSKTFAGSGGVGLISTRLTLEGPLVSDKVSCIVSARRTYADLFLKMSPNKDLRDNKLYFYDFNAKLNYRIDDRNRIAISGYMGEDVFKNSYVGFHFGNAAALLRWNHIFSQKIYSNLSLNYSRYKYNLQSEISDNDNFDWRYSMRDFSLKHDFSWFLIPEHTIKFGYAGIYHRLSPGNVTSTAGMGADSKFILPDINAVKASIYLSDECRLSNRLSVKAGFRFTVFASIGTGTVYNYDQNYNVIDSTVYKTGQIIKTYYRLSPRLGLTYRIDEQSSMKASYARTNQFLQMASNSTAGTPLDLWFTAGKNIRPQTCDQFAWGYFRNFFHHKLETSVEFFYKSLQHTIDFKDHARLFLNPKLDGELRLGHSHAYGVEFQLEKNEDKLTGWISYTYSRSRNTIYGINDNKSYPSPYERPHTIYIVGNYELSRALSVGTNFVYTTGQPITYPVGRMEIEGVIVPIYSKRNAYRMPDYHRLDLSLTWKPQTKKPHKWQGEWNVSVYNAYGHKNAWAINFEKDPNNPYKTRAKMTYLFATVPSISYNFKF